MLSVKLELNLTRASSLQMTHQGSSSGSPAVAPPFAPPGAKGDVSVLKLLGFKTLPLFKWSWIQHQTNLVSTKVLDSVQKKRGIRKKIGFGYFRLRVSSHTYLEV